MKSSYLFGLKATLYVAALLPMSALSQHPKRGENCVNIVKPVNGVGPGTTTQTVCDSPNRKEEASSTATAITAAGLSYFLITRPDRQAARNEQVHAIESEFTPIYEALDDLSYIDMPVPVRSSYESPMIKGYRLGETWQTFVDGSPNLQRRVTQCEAQKPRKTTKKPKTVEYDPCEDVRLMVENPNAHMTLDCMEAAIGAPKDMICQDFNGEVTFDGGKLVSLKVVLVKNWSEVFPDVVAKFGTPQEQDGTKTLGVWNTLQFHLVAAQFGQESAVSWITAERYKEEVVAAKSKLQGEQQGQINSLDK